MTDTATRPSPAEAGLDGPRRVLVVTADMGGGHVATSRALEEVVRRRWPAAEITTVDTLDVMGPGVGPLFRWIYVSNVNSTPWLYDFFYDSLVRRRWFAQSSKRFVGEWSGRALQKVLARHRPDMVLSTYPLGTAGLQWLRVHRGMDVPTGAWVSDFAPHPFWVYRDVDLHLVMHEQAVGPALAAEPQAVVDVCAPPVASVFTPGDRAEARERLGLRRDAFVAFVSTGVYAFGDVEAAVDALLAAGPSVQVVVACGRNEALRHQLEVKGVDPDRLVPLGWVDGMPDWLRAADVVVTNAGGATSLEALACGRPVVMYDPIAGHGRANARLMAEAGLAVLCLTRADLTRTARELATSPDRMRELADAVLAHLARHDLDSALLRLAAPGPSAPPAARDHRVRAQDAFFLHTETPDVAQQVGAVVVLDPRPDGPVRREHVLALLRERLPRLPVLRRRLLDRRHHAWRWVHAAEVDPDEHVDVVALDAGGRLDDAISDFYSTPLDRSRPLWRVRLVTGLPEGRTALLVRLHHALGDGVSVIGTLDKLVDGWPVADVRPDAHRGLSATRPDRLSLRALALLPVGLWHLARAGQAPTSPFDGRLPGPRRRVVLAELPGALVRRTAHHHGARSSELLVSAVAGALHRLLRDRGVDTSGMVQRVVVPLSLRGGDDAWDEGNWTGAAPVDVPVGPLSEEDRLAAVRRALRAGTGRGQPEAARLLMRAAGLLPASVHGSLARSVYGDRWFNAIVSYMPGRVRPRSCAGARVSATYPVLPVAEGVGLAVGLMPWGRQVGIGITVDPTLVPDADALPAALEEALGALARSLATESAA